MYYRIYSGIHDQLTFEWDEAKRASNLAKHRVDFMAVRAVFAGRIVYRVDTRRDYGEPRFIGIGSVNGVVLTFVWTMRGGGDAVRLISARRANGEEKAYYSRLGGVDAR